MPHLRMHEAVDEAAVDQRAAADAGAHRDVHERIRAAARAPRMLGEGGPVHVGVEPHGHPRARANGPARST